MDDFGKISSIESLPSPEGPHVRDFDEAQRAARKTASTAKKAADLGASPDSQNLAAPPVSGDRSKADSMASVDGQVGTLSAPDKVIDGAAPPWTMFSDLSIDQKFEQARLMDFEVRDVYLRERCRAAKLEVAYAASALDRATAIIETNLPFFLVHFEELDAQGERSDLKGKVVGKTEWLRQNLPNLSKGTFYAAFNAVKARYAEQQRMMLGVEVPPVLQPKTRTNDLTPIQSEVVAALVGQGFKNNDAISMVKAAEGQDFESLFKASITRRTGGGNGSEVTVEADQGRPGNETSPAEEQLDEAATLQREAEVTHTPLAQRTPTNAALGAEPDDRAGAHHTIEHEEREMEEGPIAKEPLSPVEPEDDDDDALIERYDPNREQPEGRPIYKIMLTVTGSRLEATLKKAQEAFGDKLLNIEKVSRISSRAEQMDEALGMIQNAKSVCEDLKDQIENWKDNLPENFQDKASQLEECVDSLEQVVSSLDEAESNAGSVEFPGMY